MSSSGVEKPVQPVKRNAAKGEKPTHIAAKSGASEFDPEYVVVVDLNEPVKKNKSKASVSAEQSQAILVKVVDTLQENGFFVSATEGIEHTALVGVRISPEKLAESVKEAQARDWQAGVLTPSVNFEGSGNEKNGIFPAMRTRIIGEAISAAGIIPGEFSGVKAVFPVAEPGVAGQLLRRALRSTFVDPNVVRLQYGEEVAYYFAFLSFALKQFAIPATLGLVFYFTTGPYSSVLSVLLLLWATVFVILWRRQEKILAAKWVTNNAANVVTPRVGYRGTPAPTRQIKGLLFVFVAFVLCTGYLTALLFALGFEVFFTQLYDGPFQSIVKLVPTGVNVALGIVFGIVYKLILTAWLQWEDPSSDQEYQLKFTRRSFYSTCVLNYGPLFLTAYVYLPFGHLILQSLSLLRQSFLGEYFTIVPEFTLNTKRLAAQTFYFAVVNQIVAVSTDTFLPFVLQLLKSHLRPDKGPAAELRRQQALTPYSVNADFLVVVSLFGYIMITSPVWPLAPLCALLGLFVRAKSAAIRLTLESQAPPSRRISSIGVWDSNLLFLAGLGAVVQPTLCAMYGWTNGKYSATQSFVEVSPVTVLGLAFVSENLFLVAVKLIEAVVHVLPVPAIVAPTKQADGLPPLTPPDAQWKDHDVTEDIKKLLN